MKSWSLLQCIKVYYNLYVCVIRKQIWLTFFLAWTLTSKNVKIRRDEKRKWRYKMEQPILICLWKVFSLALCSMLNSPLKYIMTYGIIKDSLRLIYSLLFRKLNESIMFVKVVNLVVRIFTFNFKMRVL